MVWTYEVTNIGNVTLSDLAVTDTVELPTPVLDRRSTVRTQRWHRGLGDLHRRSGRGRGRAVRRHRGCHRRDGYGTEVTDDDPSHYFGQVTSIEVVKFTNGVDANNPTDLYRRGG